MDYRDERPTQHEVATLAHRRALLVARIDGQIVTADKLDAMQRIVTDSWYRGPYSWRASHRDLSPMAWPTPQDVLRAWAEVLPTWRDHLALWTSLGTAPMSMPPSVVKAWPTLSEALAVGEAYDVKMRDAFAVWRRDCDARGINPLLLYGPMTTDAARAMQLQREALFDELAREVVAAVTL